MRATLRPQPDGCEGQSIRATLRATDSNGQNTRATLRPEESIRPASNSDSAGAVLQEGTFKTDLDRRRTTLSLNDGNDTTQIPSSERAVPEATKSRKYSQIQSTDPHEYTMVGNDVEALFPSLRDLEAARIVRESVLTSDIEFENIDYVTALKYLRVVGGDDHIKDLRLSNIAPKRPNLIALGGECIDEQNK